MVWLNPDDPPGQDEQWQRLFLYNTWGDSKAPKYESAQTLVTFFAFSPEKPRNLGSFE